MEHIHNETDTLIVKPNKGSVNQCGKMIVVFKADDIIITGEVKKENN